MQDIKDGIDKMTEFISWIFTTNPDFIIHFSPSEIKPDSIHYHLADICKAERSNLVFSHLCDLAFDKNEMSNLLCEIQRAVRKSANIAIADTVKLFYKENGDA